MNKENLLEYVLVALISVLLIAFASIQISIYFLLTYILITVIKIYNKLCEIAQNNKRGSL